MLGKFLLIKMLTIAGFVVMLLHVLFFVATLALHVLFLAPRLGKIMKRNSSRDACC
jgi:ABC-type uncharacterized transport system fused permease/ATPase subunit